MRSYFTELDFADVCPAAVEILHCIRRNKQGNSICPAYEIV